MPLTELEVEKLRALLQGTHTLPKLRLAGQLRIDQAAAESAIFVHQQGSATGVHLVSGAPSPCLKLTHQLNRCPLELACPDPTQMRDAVEAKIGDVRSRQLIGHTLNISRDPRQAPGQGAMGEIRFQDPYDNAQSPVFHWAIMVDSSDRLHIGNPLRQRSIQIETGWNGLEVIVCGTLAMRIDSTGVHVRPGSLREDL